MSCLNNNDSDYPYKNVAYATIAAYAQNLHSTYNKLLHVWCICTKCATYLSSYCCIFGAYATNVQRGLSRVLGQRKMHQL